MKTFDQQLFEGSGWVHTSHTVGWVHASVGGLGLDRQKWTHTSNSVLHRAKIMRQLQ